VDKTIESRAGETAAHRRLKRLALFWAQTNGYSICAAEVTLPQSRYRADLAAYRPAKSDGAGTTSIFECKQALPDLRRDNGCKAAIVERLETANQRRIVLERQLRVHYPALRIPDSLFAEFDSHDFRAIEHRGYTRIVRQQTALQNRLFDGTKFEKLVRYRCANLFFLVLPETLFREAEIPIGWGALIESGNSLSLIRKPIWHDAAEQCRLRLLERIAARGTRLLNRESGVDFDELLLARARCGK
jgi:hypothetical protein